MPTLSYHLHFLFCFRWVPLTEARAGGLSNWVKTMEDAAEAAADGAKKAPLSREQLLKYIKVLYYRFASGVSALKLT
jgi:hypothetical protein